MSSSKTKNKKPHGQVRQSQVVTTFGPGSMFDLPNHSVIVGGLEYWTKGDEILEPRLVAKLKELLQIPEPRAPRSAARQRRPDLDPEDGHHLLAVPGVVHHPGGPGHGIRAIDPLAPADPPVVAVEGQVHRPQQEVAAGRPGPLRAGLPQGAYRGHRLVLLRPRGRRPPAAATSGSTSGGPAATCPRSGCAANARPSGR